MEPGKTKGHWPPNFPKNNILRNYNSDWSCEQTIFVLHELRVDYITVQLYVYSINSPIQWQKHWKIVDWKVLQIVVDIDVDVVVVLCVFILNW